MTKNQESNPKPTFQNQEAEQKPNKTTPNPAPNHNPDPKITELTADLQRTRADFENFRKNLDKEKDQIKRFAKFATVEKFLPLLDDLTRAINTYKELTPLQKNLNKTLKSLDLAEINSAPGTDFDPSLHEAVMTEGEGTKEEIAETLRPGYLYEGEVLRAALVKVQLS